MVAPASAETRLIMFGFCELPVKDARPEQVLPPSALTRVFQRRFWCMLAPTRRVCVCVHTLRQKSPL